MISWNERAQQAQEDFTELYWNDVLNAVNIIYPMSPHTDNGPFHYWWMAHAMDLMIDAYLRTHDKLYLEKFEGIYQFVLLNNSFILSNDFYDDMEWMALALLRGYQASGNETYLNSVLYLWETIKRGWNEHYGGGISWKTNQIEYKNTPANMPAGILAARLYQETGEQEYLDWALKIFKWQNKTLVDPVTHIVWDGINREGNGLIDKEWIFSYCQGTYIGCAAELFKITGDETFLTLAGQTAEASLSYVFFADGRIMKSEGGGDGGLFKGIYIRYLSEYIELVKDRKWINILIENGKSLWTTGRNSSTGLFSKDWSSRPASAEDLSVQLSGLMLIEQLSRLEGLGLITLRSEVE